MFGREPIIDRDDDHFAFIGKLAAHHIVRVEIADHPAAAVKIDQARRESIVHAEV